MDRDRYQGVCPHTQDPLSQAPEHGFTIKVQVFTLVIVFYLCHGPAGNVIIINQGKAVVKASSVFCTVAAVFNGIAYDLLSAFLQVGLCTQDNFFMQSGQMRFPRGMTIPAQTGQRRGNRRSRRWLVTDWIGFIFIILRFVWIFC